MKKRIWMLLLCCMLVLTACGTEAKSDKEQDKVEEEGTTGESDEDTEEEWSDAYEEEYDEDMEEWEEEESQEGMMDFTLYNGEVVSVSSELGTWIALDKEQNMDIDVIDVVLESGEGFLLPADNVASAVKNYDTLLSSGAIELKEAEKYIGATFEQTVVYQDPIYVISFILDNVNEEEMPDASTLPVTHVQFSFAGDPTTINGFLFNENTFVFEELIAAWGDPVLMRTDIIEGELNELEYYWRFNTGYITLSLDEKERLDMLHITAWDSLAHERFGPSIDLPKYGEE